MITYTAFDFNLKDYFEAIGMDPGPFASPNLAQETAITIHTRHHSFYPKEKAPMTEAKEEMIRHSRSGLEELAFELIEEAKIGEDDKPRIKPSHHDLITLKAAADRKGVDLSSLSQKAWSMALTRMGAVKRKDQVRYGKTRIYIWALNHADVWAAALDAELARAISQPGADCITMEERAKANCAAMGERAKADCTASGEKKNAPKY